MGLWRSLFFLAGLLVTRVHSKRQRVRELGPDQGEPPEDACSLGIGGAWLASNDCTFPLLPWPLLLFLSGSLALCIFLSKGQGDWAAALKNRLRSLAGFIPCCMKDGSVLPFSRGATQGEEAVEDSEALLDEALLRDISGILQVIRHRLWTIVQDRRKLNGHKHHGRAERRSARSPPEKHCSAG